MNSNSSYSYDANGNITSDALRGLEITYNLVNLPSKIYGGGDYSDYYDYLADGTKILHEYSDGQQDEYRGSLVYYNTGEVSVPFGGGRLVSAGNMTAAHYFLTDHLGSTRVVAKVTPTGRIDLDRKDYYPFGKEWKQSGMPTSSNAFLFSGKERQHSEGYDGAITSFYDFGARFYDPDGVQFLQQDPKIEKYVSITPYNYCFGNPIVFADHDGRDAKVAIDHNSHTITITTNIIFNAKHAGIGLNVATYMQSTIVKAWDKGWTYTTEDGTQYAVKFKVNVRMFRAGEKKNYNGENNYIDLNDSYAVSESYGTSRGEWRKGNPKKNSAAHEFGHLLGLDDKYNTDSNGREPLPGWENNIMAGSYDDVGKPRQVDQRNIDMFLENAMKSGASVYYINVNNSEMYKIEKALIDKGKERPDIPVDGKWDK